MRTAVWNLLQTAIETAALQRRRELAGICKGDPSRYLNMDGIGDVPRYLKSPAGHLVIRHQGRSMSDHPENDTQDKNPMMSLSPSRAYLLASKFFASLAAADQIAKMHEFLSVVR